MTLTREEIEILQEELLRDLGWLEGGKDRLRALCAMAIRSSAGPGDRERLRALMEALELKQIDELLESDPEVVRQVGLEVAKAAKLGAPFYSRFAATTRPISTEEKPCS